MKKYKMQKNITICAFLSTGLLTAQLTEVTTHSEYMRYRDKRDEPEWVVDIYADVYDGSELPLTPEEMSNLYFKWYKKEAPSGAWLSSQSNGYGYEEEYTISPDGHIGQYWYC